MKRRAISALTVLFAMLGLSLTFAPAASAAGYGCSGNLIDSYPLVTSNSSGYPDGSPSYGAVNLYYDSSSGNNCAATVANSNGGAGVYKDMMVSLFRCSGTSISSCTYFKSDIGNYASYAGPASLYANGYCVMVSGSINYKGKNSSVQSPVGHCG